MSTPERQRVADAAARAWKLFQLEQEHKPAGRQEGDIAVQPGLLGLIRAAEEELREAQKHAAKVRTAWPPSPELEVSELLVQRTLDLIAAAQKRRDGGGATREELRNGWEVLGRLEQARLRASKRYQTGHLRGMLPHDQK